jgi:hypothetical protein
MKKTIIQAVISLSIIVIILITIFVLDLSTAKKIMGFLLCFLVLTTNIIITHSQKRKKV